MGALGHLSKGRHVAVALAVLGSSALALFGVIGDGNPEMRFDTWQTIVEPAGGDALRVTENFDQDFGDESHHGPLRTIPNTYGSPTDVVASSPDAPATVTVEDRGYESIIKIGDEDSTVTGQHRYSLSYTLPNAAVSTGVLNVDMISGDEFDTDYAEVVVRGLDLDDPQCLVRFNGSTKDCDITSGDGVYRSTFTPLPAWTGVAVKGAIIGMIEPVDVATPPLPDRRPDRRLELAIAILAVGTLAAIGVYVWARRRGRNEVYAGGAATAAFGDLPPPSSNGVPRQQLPTMLVADDRLDEMATIEFVPPKGLQPWEGATLLSETLTDQSVQYWLSGLAGREAIVIDDNDDKITIGGGPRRRELDSQDAALLEGLIGSGEPYETGKYDPAFAKGWKDVAAMQRQRVIASGWWKRGGPGTALKGAGGGTGLLVGFFVVLAISGKATGHMFNLFKSWPMALVLGALFPALIAYLAYGSMLAIRSAQGSALALRTESFRRFLHASEAQHVEWAWKHDLIREYSGWAVALGEADAWKHALEKANVPEPVKMSATPAIVVATSASIRASHVQPGRSGGGGGIGGSVGGGGGGGSRGAW